MLRSRTVVGIPRAEHESEVSARLRIILKNALVRSLYPSKVLSFSAGIVHMRTIVDTTDYLLFVRNRNEWKRPLRRYQFNMTAGRTHCDDSVNEERGISNHSGNPESAQLITTMKCLVNTHKIHSSQISYRLRDRAALTLSTQTTRSYNALNVSGSNQLGLRDHQEHLRGGKARCTWSISSSPDMRPSLLA